MDRDYSDAIRQIIDTPELRRALDLETIISCQINGDNDR